MNGIGSNDILIGGLGVDRMNGFEGNDTIKAKDGIKDTSMSCGGGVDFVELDLKDPSPIDILQCETITRAALKEAAVVRIASVRQDGSTLRVRCLPASQDRTCAGRLDAGGRARRYSIKRGKSGTVVVGVSARQASRIRRGSRATLSSVERGRFGAKTVIRKLRPRR